MPKKKQKKRRKAAIKPKQINKKPETDEVFRKTSGPDKKKILNKKNILFIIIGAILLAAVLFGIFSLLDNSSSVSETLTEEVSSFKKDMLASISELNTDENSHILDEEYYNEENAKKYISIISGKNESSVTKDDIKANLSSLFVFIKRGENETFLVQKDPYMLIGETKDILTMNKLDYAYLGLSNNEISEKSKGFYISQNNPEFLNIPYGNENVLTAGCGPISLTMAINYITNRETVSLNQVLEWAEDNKMYEINSGTRWSLIRNFPSTVSLKCQELFMTKPEKLESILSEGQILVTSMKKGHFTDSGHFIVLTGISDGKVSVLDPCSIYRSLTEWDVELIAEESCNTYWKIY